MQMNADCLIVGSGIAGLFFALKAAECGSVVLVTKRERRESNTNYAQGGIAAVMAPGDSFASHVQDTLEAGAGLCNQEVVELVVRQGPEVVRQLMEIGARFTREQGGALSLGREGGHAQRRVVHAEDLTGQEVARALVQAVESCAQVRICEHHLAVELLVEGQCCQGGLILDARDGTLLEVRAAMTLLATGGCGQVFLHTTNPPVASGDGVAMAWRAGARVANMEFVQFHPTMLYDPDGRSFLISEALRGYGAVLVNERGKAFMEHYHRLGSLATRDVVARAIVDQMQESGHPCVYLDVTGKDAQQTRRRFPNIYQYCLGIGVDLTRQPIPVVPAAHYMCGGVQTDIHGRTSLEGLYAAGEVAMTGFHGANRLASNSLLEALVFAQRASAHAFARPLRRNSAQVAWPLVGRGAAAESAALAQKRAQLRRLMWEEVGIMRSNAGLERACAATAVLAAETEALYGQRAPEAELVQLRNLATVAWLIARSAQLRRESRGVHYNRDHPERDDRTWKRDTVLEAPQLLH
jgi:L-aspartate oxidase